MLRYLSTIATIKTGAVSILAMLLLVAVSGCKTVEMRSVWRQTPIKIDGKMGDWSGTTSTYFEDQDAIVSFCNDHDYLYIQFRTRSDQWARTIKMTGLTLYIDAEGKKGKNFFIKYRGGPKMEPLRAGRGGAPRVFNRRVPSTGRTA